MARRIRYLDFDALVLINKEVVSLTREKHEYEEEDERRMKSMLRSVKDLVIGGNMDDAIVRKAALLIFRIASGQHFHEGNKRAALVAGLAFLKMNDFEFDIENPELVSIVDKAGVATASLKDVESSLRRLSRHV